MSTSATPTTTHITVTTINTTLTTVTTNTVINKTNATTTNIPYLKAATLNAHSIRNKVDIIIELFKDLDLDILCITETYLYIYGILMSH